MILAIKLKYLNNEAKLFVTDEEPQLGDLIEIFFCALYQYWGIYDGDGFIIHLAPHCESFVTLISPRLFIHLSKSCKSTTVRVHTVAEPAT